MTGKRPRAVRRASSESIIESESLAHEFSSLPQHPTEKPEPTLKESVRAPRKLVIGFNPKPLPEKGNGDVCSRPSSPNGEKSPSQRSGLESLLSLPQERKVNEGVGLGIVAAMHTIAQEEELKMNIVNRRTIQSDHVATAIKAHLILSPNPCNNASSYQPQTHRHFSPIHVPGPASEVTSGPPPSQHKFPGDIHPLAGANGEDRRAMLPWLRQSHRENDFDAMLLRASALQAQVAVPEVGPAVHFLDACCFCKRHLVDGKDIYMYRGDKAFCSTECRSQQILLDERHENCSVAARKKPSGAPSRRSGVVAAGTAAAA